MLLTNSSFANTANIDLGGNIWVYPTSNINNSTYLVGAGEITPTNPAEDEHARKPYDVSPDYRLRVGNDSVLWVDRFNHTILNTYKYQVGTSTMTIALNNGVMRFNAGNTTGSLSYAALRTWRGFPILSNFPLYVEFWAGITENLINQNVIEWGLGLAATTALPTNGAFFRLNGSNFQGVVCQNSQETVCDLNEFKPEKDSMDHYLIAIQLERVKFYKNDILLCAIDAPAASGPPMFSQSLPLMIREHFKTGVLSPKPQQFKVGAVAVSHGGMNMARLWPSVCVGMGQSSITAPDGVTPNSTCNYANSAAPSSVTLSSSVTQGAYNTLGGQWQFLTVNATETDYSLFAYQVPTANTTAPGKNLVIRGIRIETVNTGAANDAATPTVLEWGLGMGATAITPATVDSETAGTRGTRRLSLGCQTIPVSAPIGRKADPIDVNLDVPIVCEPGTYVQVFVKPQLGVSTPSQFLRGIVMFNGYWE